MTPNQQLLKNLLTKMSFDDVQIIFMPWLKEQTEKALVTIESLMLGKKEE